MTSHSNHIPVFGESLVYNFEEILSILALSNLEVGDNKCVMKSQLPEPTRKFKFKRDTKSCISPLQDGIKLKLIIGKYI